MWSDWKFWNTGTWSRHRTVVRSQHCAKNRYCIILYWINQTEVSFAWQQRRLRFTDKSGLPPGLPPTHTKAAQCFVWGTNLPCDHCCHSLQYQGVWAFSADSVCTAIRVLTFQPFHFSRKLLTFERGTQQFSQTTSEENKLSSACSSHSEFQHVELQNATFQPEIRRKDY